MLLRVAVAGLLVGHGFIHLGFVSPRPAPAPGAPPWPFDMTRSWLLNAIGAPESAARAIGWALVAVLLVAFGIAALASLEWLPAGWFGPASVVGAAASLVLLATSFHLWLVVGVAIDLVLLWGVIVAGWAPGPAAD